MNTQYTTHIYEEYEESYALISLTCVEAHLIKKDTVWFPVVIDSMTDLYLSTFSE
jgi:hypothetical protein